MRLHYVANLAVAVGLSTWMIARAPGIIGHHKLNVTATSLQISKLAARFSNSQRLSLVGGHS